MKRKHWHCPSGMWRLVGVLLCVALIAMPTQADQPVPGFPPRAQPASETPHAATPSAIAASNGDAFLYLPLIRSSPEGLYVDTQSREASSAFYDEHYLASEGVDVQWTGSQGDCNAGSTSREFRDAVVHRINYFRAMAGIPANVRLADGYNQKAQKAALMMSANGQLSHSPDPSWKCYSEDGAQAAGSSNLFLGSYAWNAIDGYIAEPGGGNYFVGHRRWILYPQTQFMGTGDIPFTYEYPAANALWVFDDNMWGPRPSTREAFVAWPPPGYVPYQVVFPRWSFGYDDADFSAASVTMTRNGNAVSLTVREPVDGFGENTLVWEPLVAPGKPDSDTRYTIRVNNVSIGGNTHDFNYDVTVFDPDS